MTAVVDAEEVCARLLAKARFYADECHRIMEQARAEPMGQGAAGARAFSERQAKLLAAAGMMNAQALGLLMAVEIVQEMTP